MILPRTDFAADRVPRPTLHCVPLGAPHAGQLVRTNAAALRDLPGVLAVLEPEHDHGRSWSGDPHVGSLAERRTLTDRPRHAGDVIGAVVAETLEQARRAAAEFDALVQPVAADAPRRDDGPMLGATRAEVATALAAAPRRSRATLTLASGPNGAMERPAAAACWDGPEVTVWSTTQCPQLVADRLAEIFDTPRAQISLVPSRIGGGFGGKEELAVEPLATLAARMVPGRPVLVELSRREALAWYRRHGGRVVSEIGYDDEGRLLAHWLEFELDCGAYVGHSVQIAASGLAAGLALYDIDIAGGASTLVLTGEPQAGAYRGYGVPQVGVALEQHLDRIAAEVGLNPIELRRRNLTSGRDLVRRARACLDAAEQAAPTTPAAPAGTALVGRGIGLAVNISAVSFGGRRDESRAVARVTADGVVVEVGAVEMGQGIHRSVQRVAAAALDLPVDAIEVRLTTGTEGAVDPGTFASRGSYVVAGAAHLACVALRELLDERLPRSVGARRSAHELAACAGLAATGAFAAPDDGMSVAAQIAEVEVDPATCQVAVRRLWSAHDVGRLLDPSRAHAQVSGGGLQAIGWLLTELPPDDAEAPTMLAAGIPTLDCVPEVEAVFVEEPNPASPLGARGLGEITLNVAMVAVANAIQDATGSAVPIVPLTPDGIAELCATAGR